MSYFMDMTTTSAADTPGGLRELKRRRTRRRIEEAATTLVAERGFEAVTVEDICATAEISRRTFFNYMPSKDEAVLGSSPLLLDDESREAFLTTPSENLVALAFDLLLAPTEDEEDRDEDFVRRLRERRQRILAAEPSLAVTSLNRFREHSRQMHELIREHLDRIPADRRLPDQPVEIEARILSGLIRESVWLHLAHPAAPAVPACDRKSLLLRSAMSITDLAKELTW